MGLRQQIEDMTPREHIDHAAKLVAAYDSDTDYSEDGSWAQATLERIKVELMFAQVKQNEQALKLTQLMYDRATL